MAVRNDGIAGEQAKKRRQKNRQGRFMAQRVCPDCGHEIDGHGRYCNFCGWDLRAGKETKPGKQDAGAVWNPEEAYARRKGWVILVTIMAVFMITAAVFIVAFGSDRKGREMPAGFFNGMSFSEADRRMKDTGFSPTESSYGSNGMIHQEYGSHSVLGEKTLYTALTVSEKETDSYVVVCHYFQDKEGASAGNPGDMFRSLKEKLTRMYGEPEEDQAFMACYWVQDDSFLILGYARNGIVELDQYYFGQPTNT